MSCWVFFNSPHTGGQNYQPDVPQIPTACISVEDAEMMSRMSLRGTKIVVHLKMGAKSYPDSLSFNTVAEIVGSKYPEQVGENTQNLLIFSLKIWKKQTKHPDLSKKSLKQVTFIHMLFYILDILAFQPFSGNMAVSRLCWAVTWLCMYVWNKLSAPQLLFDHYIILHCWLPFMRLFFLLSLFFQLLS